MIVKFVFIIISVSDYVASIDYSKCSGCGICADKCPRGIIHSADKEVSEK